MRTFVLLVSVLPACGDPKIGLDDTDTEVVDTDTDTEVDTDTDTEPVDFTLELLADDAVTWETQELVVTSSGSGTLTGEPGAWTAFDGNATVYSQNLTEGTVICDFDVALVGTAASEPCPNCEFDFDMDATLGRDASTADCDYESRVSWLDAAGTFDTSMHYVAEYRTPEYTSTWYDSYTHEYVTYTWGGYLMPPRLRSAGYFGDGYGYYSAFTLAEGEGTDTGDTGGYWSYTEGTVAFEGAALSWTNDTTEYLSISHYVDYTCLAGYSTETAALPGQVQASGELPCGGSGVADVWTVDVAEGDVVTASVDTVAEETAFYPYVWVNSPDGCTDLYAQANFPCTYGDTTTSCASLAFTADEAGTWQIVVSGWCTADAGEYTIDVDVR